MADGYPELDFDPLDDTKRWLHRFPPLRSGVSVLHRNPDNFFAETEQSAFGTGVLVDSIDFSEDKMLQGRTLSYSDTLRYEFSALHRRRGRVTNVGQSAEPGSSALPLVAAATAESTPVGE